jgi:uncharacterized protein YijF (DUF1287 family)
VLKAIEQGACRLFIAVGFVCLSACDNQVSTLLNSVQEAPVIPRSAEPGGFSKKLSDAALARLSHRVRYDPAYIKIPYPGGDVPETIGVCTDEVIRSYRTLGIDLQKAVHEEMLANFNAFPSRARWGLKATDTNIDHRRVPNLQVLFARKGISFAVTAHAKDYLPGDIVTWEVLKRPHIGLVVNRKLRGGERYMIVHNIGRGPELADMLFDYPITEHYRYYGAGGFG